MVSAFPMQPFFRHTPLTVDTSHTQQKFYEEDNSSILDDGILDHGGIDSGLEMSPPMADSRRDSFAVGSSLFSPKSEDWHSAVEMQSIPSNNPFVEPPNNNSFMRIEHPQPAPFGTQGSAWSMSNGSGSCTPLQQFDGLPADYENGNTSIFQRHMQNSTPFSNPTSQVNMFSSLTQGNQSPQKDWAGINQAMARKGRPNTPSGIRSHNDLRRGDGIRKKNARFDIPAERNLSNIDQLISQSTDEQEIKELKQQKRLLRNRQAALDSRQRKKQHTERLEDEKKQYTAMLNDMEDNIGDLKARMEQLMRENSTYEQYIESMRMEKEEMVRAHTLETCELRKKVGVLSDHVKRLEITGGGAGTGHYAGDYGDEMGMSMHNGWDNVGYMNEFPVEPTKQESQFAKKDELAFPADNEKTESQGLLTWLFLVGALVLGSRTMPSIPPVSEDIRAASATLLENVFKDAGVGAAAGAMVPVVPQPSSSAWVGPTGVPQADNQMDGVMPSMLAELGDSLTQPTQEQANEQLFSLSAAQYNAVTSPQDFLQHPAAPGHQAASQGRRNLAEALASMRGAGKRQQGAAEVYTRSLLWDQIPSDVVRSFAKMVVECNSAQSEHRSDAGT